MKTKEKILKAKLNDNYLTNKQWKDILEAMEEYAQQFKKLNQAEVSNSEAAFKSGWLKADDHPCDKEIRLAKALEEWKLLNDC